MIKSIAMNEARNPQSEDLPKKPLVEAILELRWRLEPAIGPSAGRDPGFKILLGRFFDRVRNSYPTVVDLPATQIPEEMLPHVVRHQFRAGPDAWPLLQLGPGILTANETAGYTWRTFRPRLSEAIAVLFSSYPRDLYPFVPTHIVLRYLNAIPLEPRTDQALLFLKNSLHTEISLDATLADTVHDLNQPWGINLNLTFPMKSPCRRMRFLYLDRKIR